MNLSNKGKYRILIATLLTFTFFLVCITYIGYKRLELFIHHNISVIQGPDMNYPRRNHSQFELPNGNVLIMGGNGNNSDVQNIPEMYISSKNKFIKLKKTNCKYYHPKIFKDSHERIIISEKTYCMHDIIFNIYSHNFEKSNETTAMNVNDFLFLKNSIYNKKLKDINTVNNKNYLSNTPFQNKQLSDIYKFAKVLYSKNVDDLKVINLSKSKYLFLCDKSIDAYFQEDCKYPFILEKYNIIYPANIKLKYSPVDSQISKIGFNKWILTGGCTETNTQTKSAHKHTQILFIE